MRRLLAACLSAAILLGSTVLPSLPSASASNGEAVPDWTTFEPSAVTTTLKQDGKTVVATAPSANADRMGMTMTRPLHTKDGFSIRMGVDKIGSWENGPDTSWLGFSVTDKLSTSWDITGAGANVVGHGFTCLIRPDSEGMLKVQIYRANVDTDGNDVASEPFVIVGEYLAAADASDFTISLEPVKNDNMIAGYRVMVDGKPASPENSAPETITFLANVLNSERDFYLRTVARDYVPGKPCQFTVRAVNGSPAIAFQTPEFSDWRPFDFAGNATTTSLMQNGTEVVVSTDNATVDRMGAALSKPFQLTDGFSIRTGIDEASAGTDDPWLAVAITNKFSTSDIMHSAAVQGSGVGFLLWKRGESLGVQIARLNLDENGNVQDGFVPTVLNADEAQHIVSDIDLTDFTLSLVPVMQGNTVVSYDVLVNGEKINSVAQSFMTKVLTEDTDCYLRLAGASGAGASNGAYQFTVKEVNGTTACQKTKPESPYFIDWKALDFAGIEAATTISQEGTSIVASSPNGEKDRMGVALTKPFRLSEGFSIQASIDEWHHMAGDSGWLGIAITNKNSTADITSGADAQGSGLGFLIREVSDAQLGFQLVRLNIGEDGVANANGLQPTELNSGEIQCPVTVDAARSFTLSMTPVIEGGKIVSYDFFVNGKQINSIRHTFMANVLTADTDCYLRIAGHNSAAGAFQFTVNELNGAGACQEKDADVLDRYDRELYLKPYWSGDTVYQESVWPIAEKDGSIKDIQLLYKIDEIISVRSADLKTIYKEGADYQVVNGKLHIPEGSSIPITSNEEYYPSAKTDASMEKVGGGYIFFSEGAAIHNKQIAVTYSHSEEWTGATPVYKGNLLPKTIKKLENQEELKVVFFGDSVVTGCNASSHINAAPMAETWPQMIISQLKEQYGYDDITSINTGVGGKDSAWGMLTAEENVAQYSPDLVFISFNGNEGDRPAAEFVSFITSIMDTTRKTNPNAEFIITTSFIPNPEAAMNVKACNTIPTYREPLLELEKEGVAVADILSIYNTIAESKRSCDMTGNNVNHPNDFLSRLFAQVCLSIFDKTANEPSTDKPTGVFELLKDPKYEQGFNVNKLSHSLPGDMVVGQFNYGNSNLSPVWSLAQWDSKHDFADSNVTTFKELGSGKYQYENPSKRLTVNTQTGEIGMMLDASQVYDKPRAEGEAWPHLLAEIPAFVQSEEDLAVHNVGNMDHLRLQMKMKLTEYENLMSSQEYNKDLHTSQFVLYFQVKDVLSAQPESNMMWVGIIFMDSRKEFPLENMIIDGGKEDASGRVIYTVASKDVLSGSFFKNGQPYGSEDNEWISVDFDLLPYIQKALERAQGDFNQMEGYTLDDLYIGEMNFGWEMPGTYKAEMLVKDLSVKAYSGVAYDGYKVLTVKDDSLVKIEGNHLTILKENVTLAQLKEAVNIPDGCTIAAVDEVGTELADTDVLKTGLKVRVMRGQIKETEYTVTVSPAGDNSSEPPKDPVDTGVPVAVFPFAGAVIGGSAALLLKRKKKN